MSSCSTIPTSTQTTAIHESKNTSSNSPSTTSSQTSTTTTNNNNNTNTKNNNRSKICAACGKPPHTTQHNQQPKPLRRCSRCQQVWYHDATCQRKHYPIHRKSCIPPSSSTTNSAPSSKPTQKTQRQHRSPNAQPLRNDNTSGNGTQHQQSNASYECRTVPHRGRCMIAKTFLKYGTRLNDETQALHGSTTIVAQSSHRPDFRPIVPPVLSSFQRTLRCAYCFVVLEEPGGGYQRRRRPELRTEAAAVVRPVRHLYCSRLCCTKGTEEEGFDAEEETIARWWYEANERSRGCGSLAPSLPPDVSALTLLLYRIVERIYREEEEEEEKEEEKEVKELKIVEEEKGEDTHSDSHNNNNTRGQPQPQPQPQQRNERKSKTWRLLQPMVGNIHDLTPNELTFRNIVARNVTRLLHFRCCSNTTTTAKTIATASPSSATDLTPDETTKILCQIIQNAFTITDETIDDPSIGLGLYPTAAIVNHSCQPNLVQTFRYGGNSSSSNSIDGAGGIPRLILTVGRDVEVGEELCIAYNDVMQPRVRRRKELWKNYKFWCDCARCSSSGRGVDGGVNSIGGYCVDREKTRKGNEENNKGKAIPTYDVITERLRCPTTGCCGYSIPSGVKEKGMVLPSQEDNNNSNNSNGESFTTYRCIVCNRSEGFDTIAKKRNRSLRTVDAYWATRLGDDDSRHLRGGEGDGNDKLTSVSSSPLSTSSTDTVIEMIRSSYDTLKLCCAHLGSWYVQYSGDALVRALLDRASERFSSPSSGGQRDAINDYAQAHRVLEELMLRRDGPRSSPSSSSTSDEDLILRRVSPLSLLQNRYRAAKLELFLNPDPHRAVEELQKLVEEYLVFYPFDHELVKGLRRCIQSGYQ